MKIGLCLPQLGPHTTRAAIRGFILATERNGFDSLWVQDHFMRPLVPQNRPTSPRQPGDDGALELKEFRMPESYASVQQPLELLAYAAALTERALLGTSILVTAYHRPLRLARQMSTLDVLSNGRMLCGLGLGVYIDEYQQMDTPFTERGKRMDDFIHALRAAWRPDPVSYDGPYFKIPPCESSPKPVQRNADGEPAIPVLVGGGQADAALKRIAALADGWNTDSLQPNPEPVARRGAALREMARTQYQRDTALPIYMRVGAFPLLPGIPDYDGGVFGPAAWMCTVEDMAERVRGVARAGVAHLILDSNHWEVLPSPESWARLPDDLAPLVAAARG